MHQAHLAALGLAAEPRARLAAYLDAVAAWAPRVNLTAARTPATRVAILVAPVLRAAPLVRGPSLLDVGSGNGSPGLVLALLRPELRVTLVEPRLKRWAFLRDAARTLGRDDVTVWRGRIEDYAGPPADTLTLRAVRRPLEALERAVAARALVFGRRPAAAAGWRVTPGPPGVWLAERERST